MEFAFKRGCPKHAEWRWGTIGKVLDKILHVLRTLRLVSTPANFTEKQFKDSALFDNDKKNLNMTALTHAIRSNLWWSYCKMLQIMMRFVGQLGSWAEGCPCHDWL